jgi:3-oxoacyl-[acyl-carrier protein] reductase
LADSGIEGKAALVTGGSKGIGRAVALRLAEKGVKVAVNFNTSGESAEEVVSTIKQQGGEAFTVHADVSRVDQVAEMVDKVSEAWGNIEILVNNAGIIDDTLMVRMSDEQWDTVISTNLNGTFYCSRAVLRTMLQKRWGRIISIGSVVGLRGNAGQVNYAASKAGIVGFTKALAKEVATRDITVNLVTPGYIRTDTVDGLPQQTKDKILTWIPQGHFGEVDDVAHLVAYLCGTQAKYVTGQVISVDGGLAI